MEALVDLQVRKRSRIDALVRPRHQNAFGSSVLVDILDVRIIGIRQDVWTVAAEFHSLTGGTSIAEKDAPSVVFGRSIVVGLARTIGLEPLPLAFFI
jgi:hypothetical protein